MLEISSEDKGSHVLVVVSGRLDSQSSLKLRQVLSDLIENGKVNIVLDMQGVEYLSSSGLNVLVQNSRTILGLRGQLWLGDVSPDVSDVFEMTGIGSLFPIYPGDQT